MPPIPPWPIPPWPMPPWPMPPWPMPPWPIPPWPMPPWPMPPMPPAHAAHAAVTHAAHSALTHAALTHASHAAVTHAAHSAIGAFALALLREALARGVARRGLAASAELLGDVGVAVRHVAPVRGVVAPVRVGDVGAIELVVAERIDMQIPVPPVDAGPDRRAGEDAGAKAPVAAAPTGRIPEERLVVVIRPRAVDNGRVVDRDEVFLRIARRDRVRRRGRATAGRHVGRAIDARDLLLRRRLEIAGGVCARAQPLHGVEHL